MKFCRLRSAFILPLGMLFTVLTVGQSAHAVVIFSDDFEAQSVGDQSPDLLNWGGAASGGFGDPAVHTILSENGNKFLRIDASLNAPYLGTKLDFQPFLVGNPVSMVFDARLGATPLGALSVTMNENDGGGRYALRVRTFSNSLQLRKIDDTTSTTTFLGEASFNVGTDFRTYELRATLGDGQIDFDVFADGVPIFSVTDTDPLLGHESIIRTQFQLWPRSIGNGLVADIDNFYLNADVVPEPTTLAIWSLLGVTVHFRLVLPWWQVVG